MPISLHHVLFILLPLALGARMVIRPRPATLDVAQGILRFCTGFAKWILLVDPLWNLAAMVHRGGADSLSSGVAWMGFLALLLALFFACTATGDVMAGLGGMLGFRMPEKIQETFTLRRFTAGSFSKLALLLLTLTVFGVILQTRSLGDAWLQLEALLAPPPRTVTVAFQEARVWTDFHAVTMVAALACLIGLPYSRDLLRIPAPWKAVISLTLFVLATAMLWTHASPMP